MATTALLSAFGDNSPRGTDFFDAVGFPHKQSLLHKKLLVDGKCPSGPDLSASFGHPVSNIKPFKNFANDDHIIKDEEAWLVELSSKFQAYNAKTAAMTDRLRTLNEQPVAAALGVYYKKGKDPVIAVVTNPSITAPDLEDAGAFGAQKLGDALKEDAAKEFVDDPSFPAHCVVASLKDCTRTLKMKETRFDMESDLLPVLLMEGDFYARQYNNTGLWTWLMLPEGCSPPVGLLWPTTTTYDDFIASLDHRSSPYKYFVKLLRQEEETVKAWFEAVNSEAAPFQIRIVSALQLWKQFPTDDVPEPDTLEDAEALAEYRVARNRFGDVMIIDWGLYGKSVRGLNRDKARCNLWRWLTRADASYPIELNSLIIKNKKPFIGYLIVPAGGWDFPEIEKLFEWNVEFEVPQRFQRFEPMEIGMHDGAFRAVRLQPTTDLDELEAFQHDVIEMEPEQAPSPTNTAQNPGLLQATPYGHSMGMGQPGGPPMVTPETPAAQTQNLFGATMQHQNGMGAASPMGHPAGQNLFHMFNAQQQGVQAQNGSPFVIPGQTGPTAVTPGVQQFGLPSQGQHQTPPPFTGTPTTMPNMYGMQNPWQPSPMAAMQGYPMMGALMPHPHKAPQYIRMESASMATPESRKMCNPILTQAAVLLATPGHGQLFWRDGTPVNPPDWMVIREPSSIGKFHLSSHDEKKKQVETLATHLRQAINFRAISNQEFRAIPMPLHSKSVQVATTTQKTMFNVTSWQIGRHTPAPVYSTSDKTANWHPFHLLPMVDQKFSHTFLPDNGLTQQQACQFGKILYLALSLIGCNQRNNQDHDDSIFATSYFGQILKFLCMVPQNEMLRHTWLQHPRNCTQHWMEDVCETFEVVHKLVEHQAGADILTMGIRDAYCMMYMGQTEQVLVVPSALGQTGFSNIQQRYPEAMTQMMNRFKRRWELEVNPHDPSWQTPIHSNFYATATQITGHPQPFQPQHTWEQTTRPPDRTGTEKAQKKQRQQDRTPVVISKPPFVCLAQWPTNKHCYTDLLKAKIEKGDSPLLFDPKGKTRNPLCLRSAFEKCNVCSTTGICQSPFAPSSAGIGRARLHVDFADPVWSTEQYPERYWDPLVKFVKKYQEKDLIGPSEWLKAATPNTTWEVKRTFRARPPRVAVPKDENGNILVDNSPEGREQALARVRKRWPGDGDWQCSIAANSIAVNRKKLTLRDIATIVFSKGYLEAPDYEALDKVHPDLGSPNSVVLNTWVTRPWQPNRRRIWGFGRVTSDRSCTHDVVNPISMIHYAWNFLTPHDRRQAMKAVPKWRQYADLRRIAGTMSVAPLKRERVLEDDGSVPVALDPARALMNSCGLLRFDFSHGDFIRFLGGEFTNEHRDFNAEWDVIERNLENADPPSDMPPTKLDMAYRIQTEGVPLRGNFETPSEALPVRNAYDNHPAVQENLEVIEKKFAKEEWRNYHIHYKRFVYDYIPGLVINPIQWALQRQRTNMYRLFRRTVCNRFHQSLYPQTRRGS